MVARKISKEKYVIAGVLTLLIFGLGLVLGLVLTEKRIDQADLVNNLQQQGYDSIQLQYLLLKTLENEESCPAAIKSLENNIFELDNARIKLESYIEKSLNQQDSEDFIALKRSYTLSEVRYWLLVKEAEKICKNSFVTILYFYSNKKCDDCGAQGTILTYLKEKFGEKVLIFAIDRDFKQHEPLIEVLEKAYDIQAVPTLIVNEKKFEGLTKREELLKQLCPHYKEPIQVCQELQT